MTTRGLVEKDFVTIANFIHRCVLIACDIQNKKGRKLVDFCEGLEENEEIINLKKEVCEFAGKFEFYDLDDME